MDASLYRAVNRFAVDTPWLHWLFVGFARFGIVLFALALVVAWWRARRAGERRVVAGVLWAGLAPLVALGIGQWIGGAVDRARPYTAMPASRVLVARSRDFSFPSDHATVAGAVAVGLLLAVPAGRRDATVRASALAAVVMAFARVYVGVHYPGDVLAGLLLGAAVAVCVRPVATRVLEPMVRLVARTPLRPLVGDDGHEATATPPARATTRPR